MKTKLLILSAFLLSPTLSLAQSAGMGGGGGEDYMMIVASNPELTVCEVIYRLKEMKSLDLEFNDEVKLAVKRCP